MQAQVFHSRKTSQTGIAVAELQHATDQAGSEPQASDIYCQALPSWLRFDAPSRRFIAGAALTGALPFQTAITIDGKSTVVVISERTE